MIPAQPPAYQERVYTMFDPKQLPHLSIVTGHYGCGKTNLTVNLALALAQAGEKVTIVDLDIVNPYFRTADFRQKLEDNGIRLLAPIYAGTNLDVPALPPEIQSVFSQPDGYILIDVGGDDAGAIALGQFSSRIKAGGYAMYYLLNQRRFLTHSAAEAASLLPEIEAAARLKATHLINNTNLGPDTTRELAEESNQFAMEVSRLTGLPLAFTSIDARLVEEPCPDDVFPVEILVKTSWEQ